MKEEVKFSYRDLNRMNINYLKNIETSKKFYLKNKEEILRKKREKYAANIEVHKDRNKQIYNNKKNIRLIYEVLPIGLIL